MDGVAPFVSDGHARDRRARVRSGAGGEGSGGARDVGADRAPPQPALTEAEDLEHFLREGRRKQAEKYLDTQLVAFRFEGELDPDPRQAPLVSFHPMREVVHALEEETYAFRPDAVFGFSREALSRFPSRLPEEDAYHGPLNDDDYDERVQACLASLVAAVASERPSEPFEFLGGWLDARATEEAAERDAPQPSLEQRAESVDVRDMSEDEFGKFAMDVFTRFDKDKNGVLDVWEFKEVLKSSALDFSKAEIRTSSPSATRTATATSTTASSCPSSTS